MARTRDAGSMNRFCRRACGIAIALAVLVGCAAPAKREASPPANQPVAARPSGQTAAPAARDSATPSASAQPAQPAKASAAASASPNAPAPPQAAQKPAAASATSGGNPPAPASTGGKRSPEEEREALTEMILNAVTQAQQEAAQKGSEPGAAPKPAAPAPAPAPAGRPTTAPAPARPTTRPAGGSARMELSPTEFAFGEVWQGAPTEREFTVKNVGTGQLTLTARSSCGCTVATTPKSPLEPGEETKFKVTYNTSHAGPAEKTVTLTTNDPDQSTFVIKVGGTVKTLVAASPSDRIFFNELEVDSAQSQTIRLEPKADAPLHLKVRDEQDLGPFTAEIKELEPGKAYELTVSTKPPLPPNTTTRSLILETGFDAVPTLPIALSASVPPRVMIVPPQIYVAPTATQPVQQIIQIQCRGATPPEITEITSTLASVKWEELPPDRPPVGGKMQSHRFRVTLPAYDDVPDTGASLQISTTASEEAFKTMQVPIVKARRPARPVAKP